ncbi:hypothetical protein GGTG_10775 [Gaeumannomyces tritici R3-111a-1]|uniref:Uncharacterized protein n=1 Tax=Gaeumannomyces tritici (strain R3-111a-1) TaxID=644352 RepID=J3PBA2_GAET3|nr:hypothetical protein GGTG_10775 [Gaeumannomyces tritici R3-111a-1]EJT71518.1 hypothetical protein GGTG_10775 [Gaeumannomyces tritici R3-111a-1]
MSRPRTPTAVPSSPSGDRGSVNEGRGEAATSLWRGQKRRHYDHESQSLHRVVMASTTVEMGTWTRRRRRGLSFRAAIATPRVGRQGPQSMSSRRRQVPDGRSSASWTPGQQLAVGAWSGRMPTSCTSSSWWSLSETQPWHCRPFAGTKMSQTSDVAAGRVTVNDHSSNISRGQSRYRSLATGHAEDTTNVVVALLARHILVYSSADGAVAL